jgi:hypothetical protein
MTQNNGIKRVALSTFVDHEFFAGVSDGQIWGLLKITQKGMKLYWDERNHK